ncbi:hypothetical protein SDC9_173428 [bioreactor metagenome]|uniref:Uncharacterized protein n=1 Tax=bioreactor metagenome TaxID=1076179 RepID=A0A645GIG4_9ZZZZ
MAHALKGVGISEEELLRQLQAVVVAEIPKTCRLEHRVRTRIARIPDLVARLVHLREILDLLFAAQDRGGLHHRVDYLLVAGAAAGHPVLAEPVAYLFARRVRVLVKERLSAGNEARCAETALDRAADYHRPLQGVKIVGGAYPFDRRDLRKLGDVLPARDTGADHLAVEYDVADAALAAVAAALRPRHLELFAEDCKQRYVRLAHHTARNSVDSEFLDDIARRELCLCHFLCH